jgi:tripartite-type tricarboxylate transporter receptor subunit TctC
VARLFFGIFAPAKTPKPVIARIEQATQLAMQDESLRRSFAAGGFETLASSDSASAADYVNKEIARWKPVLERFQK